jgi:hypothetical protein
LKAVADRHGWEVVCIFEDAGISGAKGRIHRPGLDALLKEGGPSMKRVRPATTTPRKLTPDEQRFVELFYALEQSRRDLYTALTDCLGYLNRHPALRETWHQFIDTGGATGDELRDQYSGTRRSNRKVFVHRHLLRCVVNNTPPEKANSGNTGKPIRRLVYQGRSNSSKMNCCNTDGPEAA